MLISEIVDFTGSTDDVTDSAEGMQNGELKQYHCRIVHSQCLQCNMQFGATSAVTPHNVHCKPPLRQYAVRCAQCRESGSRQFSKSATDCPFFGCEWRTEKIWNGLTLFKFCGSGLSFANFLRKYRTDNLRDKSDKATKNRVLYRTLKSILVNQNILLISNLI